MCIRAPNGMGWDEPLIPWDGMTFKSHEISTYFILKKDDYIQISRLIIGGNN